MIKIGEVIEDISKAIDPKPNHMTVQFHKLVVNDTCSQPVTGKCQYIPKNDQANKALEAMPAKTRPLVAGAGNEEKQHAACEQNMPELVGNKSFMTAMHLHCVRRFSPKDKYRNKKYDPQGHRRKFSAQHKEVPKLPEILLRKIITMSKIS